MKYDKETITLITEGYLAGKTALSLADELSTYLTKKTGQIDTVPERSVIAKLASLGIYKKKVYLTKRGDAPISKAEYIEKLAKLLDTDSEFLESLEKVNKAVLALLYLTLNRDDSSAIATASTAPRPTTSECSYPKP